MLDLSDMCRSQDAAGWPLAHNYLPGSLDITVDLVKVFLPMDADLYLDTLLCKPYDNLSTVDPRTQRCTTYFPGSPSGIGLSRGGPKVPQPSSGSASWNCFGAHLPTCSLALAATLNSGNELSL